MGVSLSARTQSRLITTQRTDAEIATAPAFSTSQVYFGGYIYDKKYYVMTNAGQELVFTVSGPGDVQLVIPRTNEVRFSNPPVTPTNQDGNVLMIGDRMFQLLRPLNRTASYTSAFVIPNPAYTVDIGDHVDAATVFRCVADDPGTGISFPLQPRYIDGFSIDVREYWT